MTCSHRFESPLKRGDLCCHRFYSSSFDLTDQLRAAVVLFGPVSLFVEKNPWSVENASWLLSISPVAALLLCAIRGTSVRRKSRLPLKALQIIVAPFALW